MIKILLTLIIIFTISGNIFSASFTEISTDTDRTAKWPNPVKYSKRVLDDLIELPNKPFHWNKKQWLIAGSVSAATILSIEFLDSGIRAYYKNNRSSTLQTISEKTTHFGDIKYQVPLITGFFLGGYIFNNHTMKKISADATEASIISALIINPTLCYLTGRALPNAGEDAKNFRPFTWHRYSFPSGHTTAAFALATTLDIDLRDSFGYWQTPILYGIALSVAESRLYDAKHYLSEVILGGAIGSAVGYWVTKKDRNNKGIKEITLIPIPGGIAISKRF